MADHKAGAGHRRLEDRELVVSLAVQPELPMQLISVRDIGAFAAIASDRPDQFLGRTVEIAGDDRMETLSTESEQL